ncbi:MAG: hypothetical protein ACOCVR_04620 [Myxococcota bacterium]
MKQARIGIVLLLALSLFSCQREEVFDPTEFPSKPIEPSETDVEEPAEDDSGEPGRAVLTLLEAGQEPREELRYDIPEDFSGRLDMELAMRMRRPQLFEMPRMRLGMNLFDLERDEQGFAYSFRLDEPEVIEEEGGELPADRAEGLRRDLSSAGRLEGRVWLDERGVLRDVSFSRTEKEGRVGQLGAEIEHSVRSMTMPLPEEPVGIGAKWAMTQTVTMNGLTFEQRSEMTLRERDGDRLVVETEISQTAARQQVDNPQLPPGATMHVNRMQGSSGGVSYVDLKSLMPHRPTTTLSTNESLMEVAHAGELHHIEVGMEVEMKVSPADGD